MRYRRKELNIAVLFVVIATCQQAFGSLASTDPSAPTGEDKDAMLSVLCGNGSTLGIQIVDGRPCNGGNVSSPVQMMRLHVDSLVQARYAHTVVSSTVTNFENSSQAFNFSLAVPDTAMVSGFSLELDGEIYKAHLQEKNNSTIKTTFLSSVDISISNAVTFAVLLTLEPNKTVEFTLMYEELLPRKLGRYLNTVHLTPGQIVPDLQVRYSISESTDLSAVEVHHLSNGVHKVNNTLASVSRPSPKTAVVLFTPSMWEQKQLADELNADPNLGLNGHISVTYDVTRHPDAGDTIVKDDHFAHFLAPTNLSYIEKHLIFVLDASDFMKQDRKIKHLRQGMIAMLSELSPDDSFTIIEFSNTYKMWFLGFDLNDVSFDCNVYPATSENIHEAQKMAAEMTAGGDATMDSALRKALWCAQEQTKGGKEETILLFLTYGQPTDSTPENILKVVSEKNLVDGRPVTSIHSLAFGVDADLSFLRRLSLSNGGVAQVVYEAADAAERCQAFYQSISTPLLKDITVTFDDENVDNATLTRRDFRMYFKGSELVVAGRMAPGKRTLKGKVTAKGAGGVAISYDITSANLDRLEPHLFDSTSAFERLWAFLKVSQQLDEEVSHDKVEADLPSKSTALALQYSFLTPSTCLVVDWSNPEPSTISPAPRNTTSARSAPHTRGRLVPSTSARPVPSTAAPPTEAASVPSTSASSGPRTAAPSTSDASAFSRPPTEAPPTEAPPASSTSASSVPSTAASLTTYLSAVSGPATSAPSTAAPSSVAPSATLVAFTLTICISLAHSLSKIDKRNFFS